MLYLPLARTPTAQVSATTAPSSGEANDSIHPPTTSPQALSVDSCMPATRRRAPRRKSDASVRMRAAKQHRRPPPLPAGRSHLPVSGEARVKISPALLRSPSSPSDQLTQFAPPGACASTEPAKPEPAKPYEDLGAVKLSKFHAALLERLQARAKGLSHDWGISATLIDVEVVPQGTRTAGRRQVGRLGSGMATRVRRMMSTANEHSSVRIGSSMGVGFATSCAT